ncbi:zinc finger protein 704-like [Grus japonensis]|uniref:Zinc finger protein 704-like n=1 Tax=Grus japonensis TaxID=30415 RepID=A0ABC9VTG6_GRUJA
MRIGRATGARSPDGGQSLMVYSSGCYSGQCFNIFADELDHRAECILSKFADDTKLKGMADKPHGHADIQSDVSNLEKQTPEKE